MIITVLFVMVTILNEDDYDKARDQSGQRSLLTAKKAESLVGVG